MNKNPILLATLIFIFCSSLSAENLTKPVATETLITLTISELVKKSCSVSSAPPQCFLKISAERCAYLLNKSFLECQKESNINWITQKDFKVYAEKTGDCASKKMLKYNKGHLVSNEKCNGLTAQSLKTSHHWEDNPETIKMRATPIPANGMSPTDFISLKMAGEIGDLNYKSSLLKKEPEFFCIDGAQKPAACIRKIVKEIKPKSAGAMTSIMVLVIAAMFKDKEAKYPISVISILASEALVSILENTLINENHLSQIHSEGFIQTVELEALKNNEEKMLKETVKKISSLIRQKLSEARDIKDSASTTQWKERKIAEILGRLDIQNKRSWELD